MGRLATIALIVLLVIAAGAGTLVFFAGRDDATLGVQGTAGPGEPIGEVPEGVDLSATAQGNVVLAAPDEAAAEELQALADDVTGRPTESLRAAGQAVLVQSAPSADAVIAFSSERMLRVADAGDPQLRAFVEQWLGRRAER